MPSPHQLRTFLILIAAQARITFGRDFLSRCGFGGGSGHLTTGDSFRSPSNVSCSNPALVRMRCAECQFTRRVRRHKRTSI